MELNSILRLAEQMGVKKHQFESFKFFILTKYNQQIKESGNLDAIDAILNEVKNELPSAPINHDKKSKSADRKKKLQSKNRDSQKNKSKKDRKRKYTPPRSKNKISETDAILMKLKIEYVRTPHTISQLTKKLYWDEDYFIEALEKLGFSNVSTNSKIKLEHLKPLAEQIFDRRREIIAWETEIVSPKIQKTKPNYFKLIYNSPGSKR